MTNKINDLELYVRKIIVEESLLFFMFLSIIISLDRGFSWLYFIPAILNWIFLILIKFILWSREDDK